MTLYFDIMLGITLYPNISKEYVIENEIVMKGCVIFRPDSRPGRVEEDITHIKFLEEMNNISLNIILSLPNVTSVHAELDNFFNLSKKIVDFERLIVSPRN